MYTYLTTYPSSESIYPSSRDASEYKYSQSYTAESSEELVAIRSATNTNAFDFETQSNGYQSYRTEGSNKTYLTVYDDFNEYTVANYLLFSWSMSTNSFLPFSVYVGESINFTSIEDLVSGNGESIVIVFTISHYGTYTDGIAVGGITSFFDFTDSSSIEYNVPPQFIIDYTEYSAPIHTTLQDTIRIRTTTTTNKIYSFLSASFTAVNTIETSSFTEISYQSTISTTTNIHHHIGTSINSNNSYFTVITDTNSDGFAISPYACLLSAPRTNIIFPQYISTFSQTIVVPENPEFREIQRENFGSFLPVPHQRNEQIQVSESTYINEIPLALGDTLTSERILNYLYNGFTASFSTTETNYTSRSTQSDTVTAYSYSNGSNTFGIFTTSRNILKSILTITEISGVLADQGKIQNSGIDLTTIQETILQYETIVKEVAAGAQYSYVTASVVESVDEDGINISYSYVLTDRAYGNGQVLAELNSTKPFIDAIIPPTESVYVPTIINDENWAGVGNIYNIDTTAYFRTFSEEPKIFYFKNRITYNASNLLKNNGIFSVLNKNAYNDYEFPALGLGNTFSTTTERISNTSETSTSETSTTTIFRRKILVGVGSIYDPYINTFALPESSIVSNTSFTAYTRYAVAYSNASITRIFPNGSSETIYREITYPVEYLAGYNPISNNTGIYVNSNILVSPIGSVVEHPDYITIGGSKIFTGNSDDMFMISLYKSYYATEIEASNNSSSTYTTSYEGTIFTTSDFLNLRSIGAFYKKDEDTGINYIGGYYQGTIEGATSDSTASKTTRFWDTGESLSNTIFSFTDYVGSAYIDV